MHTLAALPNIGNVAENRLNQIGIFTAEELLIIGSKEAFLQIRAIDPGACLHMLYGLEGAVKGIRYTQLTSETKDELKQFFKNLQAP